MSVLDCNKVKYTQKEATEAIKKIKSKQNYGKNNRKEKRYYQCHICKFWHLTSIDNKTWNNIVNNKRQKRISIEVDYWKNKFGIED